MSSALLYRMLKSKSSQPLHGAVRLLREDVVFLCLVENNANVSTFIITMVLLRRMRVRDILNIFINHSCFYHICGSVSLVLN